jgi:hypothetical protein
MGGAATLYDSSERHGAQWEVKGKVIMTEL